jgi:response regulator RpfG family c-di-GMP phosphodiesterase
MKLKNKNGMTISELNSLHSQIQKKMRERMIQNNSASINYLDAMTTVGNMVVEARKNKDSETLRTMSKALQEIAFYVNALEMERETLYLNTRNNYFLL